MKRALLIFYRNPSLGKVKTRLAASLGDDKALAIYIKLASYTREITQDLPFDKIVFYSEYVDTEDAWDNVSFKKERQSGTDLGERMKNAFEWALQKYDSVCIIGIDCLELSASIINQAFNLLENYEVVIGPAKDGGYYLLGMNKLHPNLFKNKEWGNYTVFSDTLEDLSETNFQLLRILSDIDEASDIPNNFSF